MGSKLSKIPFDLEFNDNECSNCNGNIEFKKTDRFRRSGCLTYCWFVEA